MNIVDCNKYFSLIAQLPCLRGDWRPYLRNYFSFTGGGRIKHVRVLLGVPTLQILRFEKKKKFEKANKARTCFIRLFELFGKFFQSQFFFRFFFAQEVNLLHFRANPGLWWGIYGKMDKISAT